MRKGDVADLFRLNQYQNVSGPLLSLIRKAHKHGEFSGDSDLYWTGFVLINVINQMSRTLLTDKTLDRGDALASLKVIALSILGLRGKE